MPRIIKQIDGTELIETLSAKKTQTIMDDIFLIHFGCDDRLSTFNEVMIPLADFLHKYFAY